MNRAQNRLVDEQLEQINIQFSQDVFVAIFRSQDLAINCDPRQRMRRPKKNESVSWISVEHLHESTKQFLNA